MDLGEPAWVEIISKMCEHMVADNTEENVAKTKRTVGIITFMPFGIVKSESGILYALVQ